MSRDEKMQHDLETLAESTRRALPTIDHTARALAQARAQPSGGNLMRTIRKPILATAIGLAAVAAVLICPVPYTRTAYDLKLTAPGGRVTVVHLPARTAAQAERRAAAARRSGALVTVEPRHERVWGSVYAMAKDKILHIDVELAGKSDAEIEAQVRDQLAAAGWTPSDVKVEQHDGESTVKFDADDGAGRHIGLVGKRKGEGAGGNIQFTVGDIDETREPGMTDDQLRDKIVQQFKARGVDAQVKVDGKRIEIRAERREESP
jgi:hypothetical protein